MDITWYGHSCFRITERGQITVVTDPYDESTGLPVPGKLKGDIVTVSHDHPSHNNVPAVKGQTYVLVGAGEYEIGGVFVYGFAMHHVVGEDQLHENVAYMVQYDGLTVLHLGDLDHVPSQSIIESMGDVNVLLVPVGGGGTLKAAEASEVVALIEPNYIVPMHYALPGLTIELDPVDKFLKEMGISRVQEEDTLRVTTSTLPEQPHVVVLRPNAE